jgi:hypothetical protein
MAAVTGGMCFVVSVFVVCTTMTVDGSKKMRKNHREVDGQVAGVGMTNMNKVKVSTGLFESGGS